LCFFVSFGLLVSLFVVVWVFLGGLGFTLSFFLLFSMFIVWSLGVQYYNNVEALVY